MRIDYYLMMLSYLGTLERVMRYLEEGVEAGKTSMDAPQKLEAQSNSTSKLSSPDTVKLDND